jgi:hypothetical protein
VETVLVCVAPEADYDLYELWARHLRGAGWEPHVVSIADLDAGSLPRLAAAIAHAVHWPDDQLPAWLGAVRRAIGPRRRLLALLPRPPASYPAETQALWTRAFGYGATIAEAVEVVNEFLAGNA